MPVPMSWPGLSFCQQQSNMPTDMSKKKKGASKHTGKISGVLSHRERQDQTRRQRKIRQMKQAAKESPQIK